MQSSLCSRIHIISSQLCRKRNQNIFRQYYSKNIINSGNIQSTARSKLFGQTTLVTVARRYASNTTKTDAVIVKVIKDNTLSIITLLNLNFKFEKG